MVCFVRSQKLFVSTCFCFSQPRLSTSSFYSVMLNHARNKTSHVDIHHITTPVASTQDEARRLLLEHGSIDRAMAVIADVQLHGRGTHGRKWERGVLNSANSDGNLYMTLCLPMEKIPVTITLLPIQVAVVVASTVSLALTGVIDTRPVVSVKWPNDVLVNNKKISGTLIESDIVAGTTWLLVGIGINVASRPNLEDGIRAAASLSEWSTLAPKAYVLGEHLAISLSDWLYQDVQEEMLLSSWREMAKLGTEYTIRDSGEVVIVQDIESDGRLRVRGEDGTVRHLVADYLA